MKASTTCVLADGCLHRPTSASRQLMLLAFYSLGIQNTPLMLNLLVRNQELTIGIRCTAHGVRCSVASARGIGSSSRTWKTPPALSTLCPAHHRATKALARVGSP